MPTIITIAALNAQQTTDLGALQTEFNSVEALGVPYHSARALNFRHQHLWVRGVGKDAAAKHAETVLSMKSEARTLAYALPAQAVTGINVYAEKDQAKRHKLHNLVTPVAQMLEALEHYHTEHAGLTDDLFVDWYNGRGRWSGIWSSYKEDTKTTTTTKAPKDDETVDTDKVDAAISSIFENTAVQEIKLANLVPGTVTLFAVRSEGAQSKAVRLNVPPAFIAGLAGAVPDPLTNAPTDLLVWRELIQTGERIIPDGMSDQPRDALRPDDVINESTPMLASNAMFLVERGMFSVASARDHDTLVMEYLPTPAALLKLNLSLDRSGYLNNRSRRVMNARLVEPKTCAGFIPKKEGNGATKVTLEGGKARVDFKHRNKRFSGQMIVTPQTEMGTAWTYRVAGFEPKAQHVMDPKTVTDLRDGFLAKAAKKPLPITIALSENGIAFAHGKADPLLYPTAVTGKVGGTARVDHGDFMRAMSGLLDAPLVGGLIWKLDAEGLLMISGTTDHATIRVYLQTLRDDGGRQRKLLDLVRNEQLDQAAA